MSQHVITDTSSDCPKGPAGVHLMKRQEGSLYCCQYCEIFRIRDRKTGEWE